MAHLQLENISLRWRAEGRRGALLSSKRHHRLPAGPVWLRQDHRVAVDCRASNRSGTVASAWTAPSSPTLGRSSRRNVDASAWCSRTTPVSPSRPSPATSASDCAGGLPPRSPRGSPNCLPRSGLKGHEHKFRTMLRRPAATYRARPRAGAGSGPAAARRAVLEPGCGTA